MITNKTFKSKTLRGEEEEEKKKNAMEEQTFPQHHSSAAMWDYLHYQIYVEVCIHRQVYSTTQSQMLSSHPPSPNPHPTTHCIRVGGWTRRMWVVGGGGWGCECVYGWVVGGGWWG